MKNKKWLLLLIIVLPSTFWILLELSTINSKRLPFFGPKQVVENDTAYYKVNDLFYKVNMAKEKKSFKISDEEFPVFTLVFLNEKYKNEGYRLEGLLEYIQYKKENLKNIPLFIIGSCNFESSDSLNCPGYDYLFEMDKNKSIYTLLWPQKSYDSLTVSYFKQKPSYVDYSFLILIDQNRNIRGYYDLRYAAEMKRMLGEYKHLRLKEAKESLVKENEIKDKNHESN